MNKETIKIKDDVRYIVGTMDEVPMWLIRDYRNPSKLKFMLGDNVSSAMKATTKETAKDMLRMYKNGSGDRRDFAILKLIVKYELADED